MTDSPYLRIPFLGAALCVWVSTPNRHTAFALLKKGPYPSRTPHPLGQRILFVRHLQKELDLSYMRLMASVIYELFRRTWGEIPAGNDPS
jgi:hypothetical protein